MKEGPDTAVARSEGAARRRTHVFSVHAGARTVLFAAASSEAKLDWLQIIAAAPAADSTQPEVTATAAGTAEKTTGGETAAALFWQTGVPAGEIARLNDVGARRGRRVRLPGAARGPRGCGRARRGCRAAAALGGCCPASASACVARASTSCCTEPGATSVQCLTPTRGTVSFHHLLLLLLAGSRADVPRSAGEKGTKGML